MSEDPNWWGRDFLRRRPDDEPWALADRVVTRGELRSRVSGLAARLAAGGIGAGSSVALRMPPGLPLLYALLAVWTRGAQVVLLDARLTAFEVNRLLRVCEPQFLLSAGSPPHGTSYLVEDVPFDVERRPSGAPATDDVCLVQVSSGSTGTPKVIGRTACSLLRELEAYAALDGMPGARDRVVLLNSVIHTMGLVGGILHGLNSGAQMVFPSRMRVADIIGAAREAGACAIFGVPVHFALLARFPSGPLPALRLAVSAGELLPDKIWAQFHERYGLPISPVYGTTETGLIAADLTTGPRPPVIGRPAPGVEVDVVAGELLVRMERTPYLHTEYADRFRDGWLHTFDRCDRGGTTGCLTYRGRADSMVTVGGLNVDLTEVEQTLMSHPGVQEAVVVCGDVIEAHIGGDTTLTQAELADWCRSRLAGFKVPKTFRLSTGVPRNANGKMIRDRDVLSTQKDDDAHTHH